MSEFRFEPNTYAGRWFPVAWDGYAPKQRAISEADIRELAEMHNVRPAHLDAVLKVEAAGEGFLLREPKPARPKILFEAHWFYRLTPKPVSKTRPDLSSPRWNRSLYKGGSAEWDRLRDACEFDPTQALKSASWGLFQVMGFNHAVCGCDSVEEFVVRMFTGEKEQFELGLAFIENANLMPALRRGDWVRFARGYNGPSFKKNAYDTKLAKAARRSAYR
jgi:hypothetical protein